MLQSSEQMIVRRFNVWRIWWVLQNLLSVNSYNFFASSLQRGVLRCHGGISPSFEWVIQTVLQLLLFLICSTDCNIYLNLLLNFIGRRLKYRILWWCHQTHIKTLRRCNLISLVAVVALPFRSCTFFAVDYDRESIFRLQ